MPGVPRELIEHALKGNSKATPKKQHLRQFAKDKREAIKKELAKLLTAGFKSPRMASQSSASQKEE